ncbi:putative porin [Algicola sagamiensis]|uniref:putative porin n=1 Tax=Algicola sagamiensis TaxID=163869 RepID=UPI000360D045|nr:putative porin [Algicola sagamiensis]
MKKTLAILIPTILSFGAQAAQHVEINGHISKAEHDKSIDNTDSVKLDATYFFKGLDTSKGPRKEAAFLSRSSSVEILANISRQDAVQEELNRDTYATEFTYHFDAPFYLAAGYANHNYEKKVAGQSAETDVEHFSFTAGHYINDNWAAYITLVEANYEKQEHDTSWIFGLKAVLPVSDSQWIAFNTEYANLNTGGSIDDTHSFDVNAEYFLNRDFSVALGVEFAGEDEFSTDSEEYQLASTYYFNSQFALTADFSTGHIEDGDNENTFGLGAQVRF